VRKIVLSGCVFLLAAVFLLAGCGGGGGGGSDADTPSTLSFYAFDFVQEETYTITAAKVGEGAHCYVYLEQGMESAVVDSDIESLASQFDNAIYPRVRNAFGSEPYPGVDDDPKIYILLMDIKDGYSSGSYIAGYFDAYNEYTGAPGSNEKEIFYMDVNPGIPSSSTFRKVLAHEFQHMIHWEQKTNRIGLSDNTWLDEAMSEVAPYFAGYGANYGRVMTFESVESGNNRSDSLTVWGSDLADYAVAYMWAQYMVDRFPDNVFLNILSNDKRGIESVEEYLDTLSAGLTFSSVFRDWSIAVFSGTNTGLTDNSTWAYKTIDTWPGWHEGYDLPGMFTASNRNSSYLPPLAPWSIDMYWYTSSPLTWTGVSSPSPQASVYDWKDNGALTFSFHPDTPYPFDNAAILILRNTNDNQTSTSMTNAALAEPSETILSPAAKLRAVAESAAGRSLAAATGEPVPVCVHDFLARREKEHRNRMMGGDRAR